MDWISREGLVFKLLISIIGRVSLLMMNIIHEGEGVGGG
jgi:hypothetical protein